MSKHFRVSGRIPFMLAEKGVSLGAVLRLAGLPENLFERDRVLLTTEELFALWRSVGEVSRDTAIGLFLGEEQLRKQIDPIVLAVLSASTFGEAVRQTARYKQLSCPEEIYSEIARNEWSVRVRWILAIDREPDVLTDLCFAWMLAIAQYGTGTRIVPLRVEVIRSRSFGRHLERYFGCPVIFGAERNALVFRASDASIPFTTSNAELLAMLSPQLEDELTKQAEQDSFAEQVRASIQRKLTGCKPSMQDVAHEFHMSVRTLQRRLKEMGTSYQHVLEEARHQRARHYLTNSLLELSETAYMLGYEDTNSFVRAFRGWEGLPPARWREAQREKTSPRAMVPVPTGAEISLSG